MMATVTPCTSTRARINCCASADLLFLKASRPPNSTPAVAHAPAPQKESMVAGRGAGFWARCEGLRGPLLGSLARQAGTRPGGGGQKQTNPGAPAGAGDETMPRSLCGTCCAAQPSLASTQPQQGTAQQRRAHSAASARSFSPTSTQGFRFRLWGMTSVGGTSISRWPLRTRLLSYTTGGAERPEERNEGRGGMLCGRFSHKSGEQRGLLRALRCGRRCRLVHMQGLESTVQRAEPGGKSVKA